MGLDNVPQRCSCTSHEYAPGLEGASTHLKDQPCPLDGPDVPKGPIFGNCCWLRGKVAAHELEALGENDLAERMYQDMTCQEALAFAEELGAAADRLEQQYAKARRKPKGAGWNGQWDEHAKDWVWQTYSTFEEALAEIRVASRWFEKIGQLGFGVHAWF